MISFDHSRLIDGNADEIGRMIDFMLSPGAIGKAAVMHERDGSCCQREPFGVTRARIQRIALPGVRVCYHDDNATGRPLPL